MSDTTTRAQRVPIALPTFPTPAHWPLFPAHKGIDWVAYQARHLTNADPPRFNEHAELPRGFPRNIGEFDNEFPLETHRLDFVPTSPLQLLSANARFTEDFDPLFASCHMNDSAEEYASRIAWFRTHFRDAYIDPDYLQEIMAEDDHLERMYAQYDPFAGNTLAVGMPNNLPPFVAYASGAAFDELHIAELPFDGPPRQLSSFRSEPFSTAIRQVSTSTSYFPAVSQPLIAAREAFAVRVFDVSAAERGCGPCYSLSIRSTLRFPHRVCDISFSPHDPFVLAVATADGAVALWDGLSCPLRSSPSYSTAPVLRGDPNFTETAADPSVLWRAVSFAAHPRTLLVGRPDGVFRVDCRAADGTAAATACQPVAVVGAALPATGGRVSAMSTHAKDAFTFVVATECHIAVFDERRPHMPTLLWPHFQTYEPPQLVAVVRMSTHVDCVLTANRRHGELRVYEYTPSYVRPRHVDMSTSVEHAPPQSAVNSFPLALPSFQQHINPRVVGVDTAAVHGHVFRHDQPPPVPAMAGIAMIAIGGAIDKVAVLQQSDHSDVYWQTFVAESPLEGRRRRHAAASEALAALQRNATAAIEGALIKRRLRTPAGDSLRTFVVDNAAFVCERLIGPPRGGRVLLEEDFAALVDAIERFTAEPKTLYELCRWLQRVHGYVDVDAVQLARWLDAAASVRRTGRPRPTKTPRMMNVKVHEVIRREGEPSLIDKPLLEPHYWTYCSRPLFGVPVVDPPPADHAAGGVAVVDTDRSGGKQRPSHAAWYAAELQRLEAVWRDRMEAFVKKHERSKPIGAVGKHVPYAWVKRGQDGLEEDTEEELGRLQGVHSGILGGGARSGSSSGGGGSSSSSSSSGSPFIVPSTPRGIQTPVVVVRTTTTPASTTPTPTPTPTTATTPSTPSFATPEHPPASAIPPRTPAQTGVPQIRVSSSPASASTTTPAQRRKRSRGDFLREL